MLYHLSIAAIAAVFALFSPAYSFADTTADDPIISVRAAEKLVGKDGVVFLHVGRNADAFAAGYIPGARFLPLDAFTEERNGVPFELPSEAHLREVFGRYGIDRNQRVIIYSDYELGDIDVLAAARAYFTLDALGHRHVAILDGGLPAWRAAGHDLVTGPSAHEVLTFDLRSRMDNVVVDASAVNARLGDDALRLIDARPHDQFTGEDPGPGIERPGHIPGAANLFWKDFLNEDGTIKSIEQLAEMWTAAGVERDSDVVVYCRTGMQASFAYLIARYLGIQPQMYDASYIDWSNNTQYPVDRG
jgi:thiosulfate/3-mercaptopyruvate sulfurtransferase